MPRGKRSEDSAQMLANLLRALVQTRLKPDGSEYSTYEVAQGIRDLGLGELDPSYIARMLRGEAPRVGRGVILQLCAFFRVPASYFFPELEQYAPEAEDSEAVEDPKTRVRLALRSAGIDARDQVYLEELIESLRQKKLLEQQYKASAGEHHTEKEG
jgi:transcriptional regulator with XRE-family HTH domain